MSVWCAIGSLLIGFMCGMIFALEYAHRWASRRTPPTHFPETYESPHAENSRKKP
jgi:hypothetical protein